MVATKFFPYPWRLFRRGSVLQALKASLKRLDCEQVALYQVHSPLPLLPATLWVNELVEAVRQGLTQAVGVSNFSAKQLRQVHAALAKRGVQVASNQVHYSLLHRRPETDGVLQACRDLNVRLIAYSPLALGLLGGRYSPQHPPPAMRRMQVGGMLKRSVGVLPALHELGARHDKTPAQVALNWLICKGAVPIPGAKSNKQARENAGALGWRLEPEEIERLDRIA